MKATYVALLRSVNVAGHGKVKMSDLADVFRRLGYAEVSTYIQSGNVIFMTDEDVAAADIEAAICADLGMDITIMVRTAAELARVVEGNPFVQADPSTLHVGFMPGAPSVTAADLDLQRFLPEAVVVDGANLYLHLPNGMGRAKLPVSLGRQLGVPVTFRNWNTVTKLAELANG